MLHQLISLLKLLRIAYIYPGTVDWKTDNLATLFEDGVHQVGGMKEFAFRNQVEH